MRALPKLRAFLYPLLLIPLLTILLLAFVFCLRNGEVPTRLVNSRFLGRLAEGVGVQYSINSLHFGCFRKECRSELDISGLQLRLNQLDSTSVMIDNIHSCSIHPLAIRGLSVLTPNATNLHINEAELSSTDGSTQIRDVSV